MGATAILKLERAGFTHEQVDALAEYLDDQAATKADVSAVKAEVSAVKVDVAGGTWKFKSTCYPDLRSQLPGNGSLADLG